MSETFRSKAQHLAEQVISDVKTSTIQEPESDTATPAPTQQLEGKAATVEKEPHAYHEESRASEFGTLLNGVIFGVQLPFSWFGRDAPWAADARKKNRDESRLPVSACSHLGPDSCS
jgi:hypothetical protein